MKKFINTFGIVIIILLGGCQMGTEETKVLPKDMDPEELPDERVFQEAFTREFIQSTKETRPGYYHFLSKTGMYEMDFPADGAITEGGYALRDDQHEGFNAVAGLKNDIIKSSMNVMYHAFKTTGFEGRFKDSLEKRVGLPLDFKTIKGDGQTLYIAPFEYEENGYGYAGFLQNEKQPGGIDLIYRSSCDGSTAECSQVKEKELQNLYNWMLSVKFIHSDEAREK